MNGLTAKVSKDPLICDFCTDFPILYSEGRTLVPALLVAREADIDKLSKFAV